MYEMSLDPVEKALNREFVQRLDYYRNNHNFRPNQWRQSINDYGAVQVAELGPRRFRSSAKQDGRGAATAMGNY